MEYVPDNAIPYVSLVDAGTVELIRGIGPAVVSSADFVQRFEAVLTPAQMESHRVAGRALMESLDRLLPWLREQIISDVVVTELSVQQEFAHSDARRRDWRFPRTTNRWSPSMATPPIHTTARPPRAMPFCARAICCCSTSARRSWVTTPSLPTIPGWSTWGNRFLTESRRSSAS